MDEKSVRRDFAEIYKKKIADAIELEKKIFGNAHSESEYYDNAKRGLQIEIRYADEKQNDKIISYPCAFIAIYNRVEGTALLGKTTKHIWLCGVLPELRGKGLMKGLFYQCFAKDANFLNISFSDDRKQFDKTNIISVHTYPDFYKEMFALISKYGFKEEKELIGKYKEKGKFVRYVTTFEEINLVLRN